MEATVIHISRDRTTFIVSMADGRQVTLVTSSSGPCLWIGEEARVMLSQNDGNLPVAMTHITSNRTASCFFRAVEVH